MAASAALLISVTTAAASIDQQKKSAKNQKKANEERSAAARAGAVRERQQQIRQARIARAEAVNQAYTSGGQGSTLSGATSSIQSQLGANLGFSSGTMRRSENAAGFDARATDYATRANAYGTVSSVAGSYASFGGGKTKPHSADSLFITTPKR